MTTIRPHWRGALVLGTVALLTWTALSWAAPARARDNEQEVSTAPSADAWYSSSGPRDVADPTCSAVAGCVLANSGVADYPEGTLHVGAESGEETARSLLQLDLSVLPEAATLTGGTLKVPVGPASDGTSQPASARVLACLVRDEVDAADGDPVAEAPEADCFTSVEARVNTVGTSVTVDLSAFAPAWHTSRTASLALLPAEAALEEGDTWHLAFSRTDRESASPPPPSATLTYTTAHHDGDDPRAGGGSRPSPTPPPGPLGDTHGPSRSPQQAAVGPVAKGSGEPVPPRVAPPAPATPDPSNGPVAASPVGETLTDDTADRLQTWILAGSGAPAEAVAVIPLLTGLLGVVAVRSLDRPMPAGDFDPDADLDDEEF